jgi:hypothetical protein
MLPVAIIIQAGRLQSSCIMLASLARPMCRDPVTFYLMVSDGLQLAPTMHFFAVSGSMGWVNVPAAFHSMVCMYRAEADRCADQTTYTASNRAPCAAAHTAAACTHCATEAGCAAGAAGASAALPAPAICHSAPWHAGMRAAWGTSVCACRLPANRSRPSCFSNARMLALVQGRKMNLQDDGLPVLSVVLQHEGVWPAVVCAIYNTL